MLKQIRNLELDWKRSNKVRPCPVCNNQNAQGKTVSGKCRIGTERGRYTASLVVCWNVESDRLAGGNSIGGWLHVLEPRLGPQLVSINNSPTTKPKTKIDPQQPPLTATERDKGFRAMLEACQLLQPEADYLAGENLTPSPGDMVRSFRRADTKTLAAVIVAALGSEARAELHPAIKRQNTKDGRSYLEIAAYVDGLLLPAIGLDGLIAGVQIRNMSPDCKKNRYVWVSCDGKGGTPLATFRAPASTSNDTDPAPHHTPPTPTPTILTEGWKKARRCGLNAIAVAGVQSYKLPDILAALDTFGTSELEIAFDADKRTNNQVARAEQTLINKLTACRPNLKITILEWAGTKGKGLDDALNAGLDLANPKHFTRRPASASLTYWCNGQRRRLAGRLETGLPIEAHHAAFPDASKPRPVATLAEIEADNEAQARAVIFAPKGETQQIINANITGTGKTYSVTKALAQAAADENLDKRFLLLLPDKRAVAENTEMGTPLGAMMAAYPDVIHIQLGRRVLDMADPVQANLANNAPTDFDCHNPLATVAGQNRQIPAVHACADCPFGNLEKYQAAYPAAPDPAWLCNENGYVASKEISRTARIVVATHDSYLNGSKELDKFDTIIIDEKFYPKLLEQFVIGGDVIAGWQARLEQITRRDLFRAGKQSRGEVAVPVGETALDPAAVQHFAANWHKFFDIISAALSAMPRRFAGLVNTNPNAAITFYPTVGAILDAADKVALLDRFQFFDFVHELLEGNSNQTNFNFEAPYGDLDSPFSRNYTPKIPFRGAVDLLKALISVDMATLTLHAIPTGDGTYKLEVYRVRDNLIEVLRKKQLLILDATPDKQLKKLLPTLQPHAIEARQNLEIWQITSGLYTRRDLAGNERTRRLMGDAVAGWLTEIGASRPVVVVPKALQSGDVGGDAKPGHELVLPEGATVEHWGLHKSSNRFIGCDAIALVGHFVRPSAYVKAELDCIRAFLGETEEARDNNYWLAETWPESDDDTAMVAGDDGSQDTTEVTAAGPGNRIKVYNHVQDGQAVGRWTRQLADKELQEWLDSEYQADVMQAVGRLRAIRQPYDAAPLKVLIASSDPVGNLPIDRLVSARDLAAVAELSADYQQQPSQLVPVAAPVAINSIYYQAGLVEPITNTPLDNIQLPNIHGKVQISRGDVADNEAVAANEAVAGQAGPLETVTQTSHSLKYQDFEAKLTSRNTPEAIASLLDRVTNSIWLGGDGKAERDLLIGRAKKRLDELRRTG